MNARNKILITLTVTASILLGAHPLTKAEVLLQYFNASWNEIAEKVPELAEAGYTGIWLPPPAKANGGYSVGYDLYDPFDIGSTSLRGTYSTRYGTEAELHNLVDLLHRFGIRVYFDNIMNHRAYDIPGYNESTPVNVYPGMVAEDFHLRKTSDGFYRRWDNCRDWSDEWQVLNLGLSDLIDISHESPNCNFGTSEGSTHSKPSFVRHPNNPEFYDRMPNTNVSSDLWNPWDWSGNTNANLYVGFGTNNGLTAEMMAKYPGFFSEDVGGYLMRNARWMMDTTKADGFRLDAVKHVPYYFFSPSTDPASSEGYLGSVQWQFNMTHGYSDWANHRDTVFSEDNPRDDALVFGEHLGTPPSYDGYISAGMRLVDNPLRSALSGALGNNGLTGYDAAGYGGFSADVGVMHSQSHDNVPISMDRRPLEHCFYTLRDGLGLFYTDGNNHAATLSGSGGAFPRWADNNFLGQWGDNRMPNLCRLNEDAGRGWQHGVWSKNDFVAWERIDWRQGGADNASQVTALILVNAGWDYGQPLPAAAINSVSYPHTSGGAYGSDAYLYQYADIPYIGWNEHFYTYASALSEHIIPANCYYVFGYKNPDPSGIWAGDVINVYEDGQMVDYVNVDREDGADGDPGYNPHGLPDGSGSDYTYTMPIPRITKGTSVVFSARVDGSAGDVMMRLDGGMDLNGQTNVYGDLRDNPPALANDIYLGFESVNFNQRIWAEKFASPNSQNCQIGSEGSTSYQVTIGQSNATNYPSSASNEYGTSYNELAWIWHDPANSSDTDGSGIVTSQYYLTGSAITIWAKTPKISGTTAALYYTTNGTAWPEGAGGSGANPSTKAIVGSWVQTGSGGETDWWKFEIPQPAAGTVLRYKVSAYHQQGDENGWEVIWPGSAWDVAKKLTMMGQWSSDAQNLKTKAYHKHNDYNSWTTGGLDDGFHLMTVRAFLNRTDGAAVYNTFRQTIYLDTETPQGEVLYPDSGTTSIGGSQYGFILRTDSSVRDVWYHITDSNDSNDGEGNGLNTNGVIEWAKASAAGAWTSEMAKNAAYPKLWRFTYARIPSGGDTATVRIRLREWSSAATNAWSSSNPALDNAANLHYTELTKTLTTWGDAEDFYFDWPSADGTMVEEGWQFRMKYTARMAAGLSDAEIFSRVKIYVNATENGSTEGGELQNNDDLGMTHTWNWGSGGEGENILTFNMPNVYNGMDGWLYGIRVVFTNANGFGTFNKTADRLVLHRGALLPTVIITTPSETDSDGAAYIIEMPDVPASVIATNPSLRQTPIVIQTDAAVTNVQIRFNNPTGYTGAVALVSVTTNGSTLDWAYTWSVTNAGSYRFNASVWANIAGTDLSSPTNSATRNATIRFREICATTNTNDYDWDDDGMINTNESTTIALPSTDNEYWTQTQVFNYFATGKSLDESPDSDGDGLPDALELGYRAVQNADYTDTDTDTNGDGFPNFIADLDPPFYNTTDNIGKVPKVDGYGTGGTRTKLLTGGATSPSNADSDYDGLPDGVEDANRNGWADGDGVPIPTDWNPWLERDWPDGLIGNGETWEESSANLADSDADGLSDGYGEDKDYNGRTDLFLLYSNGVTVEITREMYGSLGIGVDAYSSTYNSGPATAKTSRAINYNALFAAYSVSGGNGTRQTNGWPRLLIRETDPLCTDTDHDGLPDGWERRYSLDPLDNGSYNFYTGAYGASEHGASGNPDNDTYLDSSSQLQPYTNLREYQNGTNPRHDDSIEDPGGEGTINIGEGPSIGTVNATTFYREFLDWKLDDLIALDNYDQGGNSSDIYRWGDGYNSSRDMMAFYFRDGGASGAGGDDKLYFRVDFDNLQAHAEESSLNVYVAINYGNYGSGEYNLPDQVNAGSAMKWNACVGVYDGASGVLYVDQNSADNTTEIGGDLTAAGVVSAEGGYLGAYFNSELDAVAFAIDRSALIDAGWLGNPDSLTFQVYTVRDFTGDDGGAGDKGGLNDFTDTIGDDWLCSDYYQNYDYIAAHGVYSYCVGRTPGTYVFNHLGQSAKLALLAHGNQALEPGYTIQNLVNDGNGAGYHRPVAIHNIYTNAPLNLHITPTLAMALEWADVGTANIWFSGPALNQEIRTGVAGGSFRLLGSTFGDHVMRYFDAAFNSNSVALAQSVLNEIYGGSPTSGVTSAKILWLSERVADLNTLKMIEGMGFDATILDQTPHLYDWYGREAALGDNAYRINRLWLESSGTWPSLDAFIISTSANDYRYVNTDNGLPTELRQLFNRRARAGGGQISTVLYQWENFTDNDSADSYDRNLRWIANHPWIQVVTLEDSLNGSTVSRDVKATNTVTAQDWAQHACNENYDNWYYGSSRHEGLAPKVYEVRLGTNMPSAMPYGSMTNGVLSNTWAIVRSITNADVRALAMQTLFASVFETAMHGESNNDLSRWSYGEYIYPATDWQGLQGFSWKAQGQTRRAAIYAAVDTWAGRTLSAAEAISSDVDLDGESEYILQNNSVMALFERSGGRMVGAWSKNGSSVRQMIGNFVSMPDSGAENEGDAVTQSNGDVAAHRTSALKDWWDVSASTNRVNDLYAVTTGSGTLTFTNSGIRKVISLASAATNAFNVAYTMNGKTLYVRNGLSPDLNTLLRSGQEVLVETNASATSLQFTAFAPGAADGAGIILNVTSGAINTTATDKDTSGTATYNTVNMRNQAQTRQVELVGTNTLTFSMAFITADAPSESVPLSCNPAGPYTWAVGSTNSILLVTEAAATVTASNMPAGSTLNSKTFSWSVPNLTVDGSRTNDWAYTVLFTAVRGSASTSLNAVITVPWDSDADDMGDDWERLMFGNLSQGKYDDYDGDGFVNYAEWVAGTGPNAPGEYIGWESQFLSADGMSLVLTFQCVSGATYRIETADTTGLVAGDWTQAASLISTNIMMTWADTNYPYFNSRMYRIKVPNIIR